MSIEEKIAELSKKIDDYQLENTKRAKVDRYENLSYILWGFALATLSLAVTKISIVSTVVSGVIAVIFTVFGFITLSVARRNKKGLPKKRP